MMVGLLAQPLTARMTTDRAQAGKRLFSMLGVPNGLRTFVDLAEERKRFPECSLMTSL
jgi:hypothetical protein